MQTFTRNDLSLAYDLHGDGACTVICLPGMGDLRSQYRHTVPLLVAAGCRVVTVDLRGHGDSDVGFDRYDPAAIGDDVIALMDHLGIDRAVVAGNSAAGASAVWAAAEAPERIEALLLLGPVARDPSPPNAIMLAVMRLLFLRPWGPWLWIMFYGSLFKSGKPDDHGEHAAAVRANAWGRGRLTATLENGMTSKVACEARIGDVRCPSLVVMGTADPDFDDASAEGRELSELLGGEGVLLDGVGHYPHMERPAETADLMIGFLRERGCLAA